jgi:tetratricopeptide (TPR) repeat protein
MGFARDMYSASDFIFCPRRQREDFHEEFPLNDLEAIAAGCIPLFKMGSLLSEFCGESGIALDDVNFQSIADGLAKILNQPGGLNRASNAARAQIEKACNLVASDDGMRCELDDLIKLSREMKMTANSAAERMQNVLVAVREGKVREPLVTLEECLLASDVRADVRAELLTEKGLLLNHMGRLEDAFEALNEAVRLDEDNMAAYRGLGFLSLKSHSHEEAISFFKKALSRNDKDIDSMFGVGVVHRRLGLNDEALYWLERSLLIEPTNQKIRTALAQTCLDCYSPQRAIASLERIQGQIGQEASLMLTLGQLYLRDGRAELGNELVSKALEMQRQRIA